MSKCTVIQTAALGAALCASGAFGATTSESIEAVVYRDVFVPSADNPRKRALLEGFARGRAREAPAPSGAQ